MMQLESWRPVVGFEGFYEVSDIGRVRSLQRRTNAGMRGGKFIKGYLQYNKTYVRRIVGLSKDGKTSRMFVHRLVAAAFCDGQSEINNQVLHNDGDSLNNCADNLRWGSQTDNMRDCVLHGTHYSPQQGVSHCKHGHEFTESNTYVFTSGKRGCKLCTKRRHEARKQRLRREAA